MEDENARRAWILAKCLSAPLSTNDVLACRSVPQKSERHTEGKGARHYGAQAGKADAETEERSKGGSSCSTISFGAQHRMEPDTTLNFQIRE